MEDLNWIDRARGGGGVVADSCECVNELSGFIECGEFVD
jgi:hypothetical protein